MAGKPAGKTSSKTSRKPYRVGRSPNGLGLFATAPIAKGAFIVEYKGRRITNAQAERLEARGSRYMYEINSRWTVDGSSRLACALVMRRPLYLTMNAPFSIGAVANSPSPVGERPTR